MKGFLDILSVTTYLSLGRGEWAPAYCYAWSGGAKL